MAFLCSPEGCPSYLVYIIRWRRPPPRKVNYMNSEEGVRSSVVSDGSYGCDKTFPIVRPRRAGALECARRRISPSRFPQSCCRRAVGPWAKRDRDCRAGPTAGGGCEPQGVLVTGGLFLDGLLGHVGDLHVLKLVLADGADRVDVCWRVSSWHHPSHRGACRSQAGYVQTPRANAATPVPTRAFLNR